MMRSNNRFTASAGSGPRLLCSTFAKTWSSRRRLINRQCQRLLDASDLFDDSGAPIQQFEQLQIYRVDSLAAVRQVLNASTSAHQRVLPKRRRQLRV